MVEEGLQSTRSNRIHTTDIEPIVDGIVKRGRVIRSSDTTSTEANLRIDVPRSLPPGEIEVAQTTSRGTSQEQDKEEQYVIEDDSNDPPGDDHAESTEVSAGHIRFSSTLTPRSPLRPRAHSRIFSMQGIGARPNLQNHPRKSTPAMHPIPLAALTQDRFETREGTDKYFQSGGFIGRNSQFHSLTVSERERLGGVEYRALVFLAVIVPVYYVLWQLLGCLGLGAWTAHKWSNLTSDNNFNPWWYVIYISEVLIVPFLLRLPIKLG